jgi:hypothetical protein
MRIMPDLNHFRLLQDSHNAACSGMKTIVQTLGERSAYETACRLRGDIYNGGRNRVFPRIPS